jgi:hypothetical protein
MKMKLSVNIEGKERCDLEFALAEVLRLVTEGYLSGHNENDTGNFSFYVKEE